MPYEYLSYCEVRWVARKLCSELRNTIKLHGKVCVKLGSPRAQCHPAQLRRLQAGRRVVHRGEGRDIPRRRERRQHAGVANEGAAAPACAPARRAAAALRCARRGAAVRAHCARRHDTALRRARRARLLQPRGRAVGVGVAVGRLGGRTGRNMTTRGAAGGTVGGKGGGRLAEPAACDSGSF